MDSYYTNTIASNKPFIGRNMAKQQLRLIINETKRGIVQTVFIKGEAGIGKTRLVREVASEFRDNEWIVLRGEGQSLEQRLAFAPIIQAFRNVINNLSNEEKIYISQNYQYINVLFPELNGPLPIPLQQPDIERTRLFENLRLFMVYLASKRPLVFWIDDIPEADSETLDWIQYCVKHTEHARFVFIGTYRTSNEKPFEAIQKLETYFIRHQMLQTISLDPLSREDSKQLISEKLDQKVEDKTIDIINERTLGIPLYIIEIIRNLKASGELLFKDGVWSIKGSAETGIPFSIKSLLEQKINSLSSSEMKLLPLFIVSNEFISWEVLQKASNCDVENLVAHIENLKVKGFIQEEQIENNNIGYKISHPMLKAVCKENVNNIYLQQSHEQLAKAWYKKDVLRAAYHILSSGDVNNDLANSEVLLEAGKRYSSLGSYDTALKYFTKAYEILKSDSNDSKELQWNIHLNIIEALTNTGKQESALELLNDLFFKYRENDKRIKVKREMAWIEVNRSYEEAIRHINEGLSLWNGLSENEDILWLLNEQVINHLNARNVLEAEQLLKKIQKYVGEFNSPRAELLYYIRTAHVALMNWRKPSIGLDEVNKTLEKAYRLGDPELIYDVYCLLGYIALNQGDYKTALRFSKECLIFVRKNGMVIHELSVRLLEMCGLFMRGSWQEAYKEAEKTEALAREFEIEAALVCALDLKGLILIAQGKEEGNAVLQKSEQLMHEVFPEGGMHTSKEAIHIVRAVEYLIKGNTKQKVKSAKTVYWANSHGLQIFIKLIEGILLVRGGFDDDTKNLLQQLSDAVPDKVPNYITGILELVTGLQFHVKGAEGDAKKHLFQALATFESLRLPLEQGLVHAYFTEIYKGEQRDVAFCNSKSFFEKIEAHALVDWVTDKHMNLSEENNSQTMIETLTNREKEILQTLASGLSNKEIAEKFGLTVGTVKIHLNNLYGKLGVNRRLQAVNRAKELSLI